MFLGNFNGGNGASGGNRAKLPCTVIDAISQHQITASTDCIGRWISACGRT